jgi:hypothetical protein
MKSKEISGKEGPAFEEIAVIEKTTGGLIATHEWWEVKGVDGAFRSYQKPSHEEDILYHGVLKNSFVSKGGEYIGDFERAQWYQKHRLKVYEPYAHGVAEVYTEDGELEGYCGYTHRGAAIFRIGDRLFTEEYEPQEKDYSSEQWADWKKEYDEAIAESEAKGDTWWVDDIKKDGVGRFIPFKMLGPKKIESLEEAAQAAENLSKHLS